MDFINVIVVVDVIIIVVVIIVLVVIKILFGVVKWGYNKVIGWFC